MRKIIGDLPSETCAWLAAFQFSGPLLRIHFEPGLLQSAARRFTDIGVERAIDQAGLTCC